MTRCLVALLVATALAIGGCASGTTDGQVKHDDASRPAEEKKQPGTYGNY